MAIGRISGQLLKDNLLREGVNLRFENDLLYLLVSDSDPANHKIGVKNSNPSYTLDVTGTTRSSNFIGGSLEIDDLFFDNNTVSSTAGDLIFNAATIFDKIVMNNNLRVEGNIHATGAITADGSITLGDDDTDDIIFSAEINSDIIPNTTDTFKIGSSSKRWDEMYSASSTIGDIKIFENIIENLVEDANFIVRLTGSGSLQLLSQNILMGVEDAEELIIDSNSTTVKLFNTGVESVTLASSADNVDIGSDEGTVTINNSLDVKTDANIENDFSVSGESTFDGLTNVNNELNVTGATNIDGLTNVNNQLNVTGSTNFSGLTNVNNELNVSGATKINDDLSVNGALSVSEIKNAIIDCGEY